RSATAETVSAGVCTRRPRIFRRGRLANTRQVRQSVGWSGGAASMCHTLQSVTLFVDNICPIQAGPSFGHSESFRIAALVPMARVGYKQPMHVKLRQCSPSRCWGLLATCLALLPLTADAAVDLDETRTLFINGSY